MELRGQTLDLLEASALSTGGAFGAQDRADPVTGLPLSPPDRWKCPLSSSPLTSVSGLREAQGWEELGTKPSGPSPLIRGGGRAISLESSGVTGPGSCPAPWRVSCRSAGLV